MGDCMAGYLCISGAEHPGPNDGLNGPCPIGHYCLEGTINATACPRGTIRDQVGGAELADCYPCTSGYYCADEGASVATGPCDERYYCPDFAEVYDPRPSDYPCPPGFYCLNNTATP